MDNDGDLFVKNGVSIKFSFHKSVRQGRGRITHNVERRGGEIVDDERTANVLLVDDQEDIAFLRRQYYSSTELYRLCIYVEPCGFVQSCIRSRTYRHVGPIKQGMPGRAPGHGTKPRVPFTDMDRDHLAYYLATRCPTRDGRMGNNAYKDLERLSRTEDASWAWTSRHTWSSWREHYKTHSNIMDPIIDRYAQQLKHAGHHFGHDPRSHDYCNVHRRLAEENERPREGTEKQEKQNDQGPVQRLQDQATRDLVHHEELLTFGDNEEEAGSVVVEPQCVKRSRIPVDPRDNAATQAKRARVSTDERRVLDREPIRENVETRGSQEIKRCRHFRDRERGSYANQGVERPALFSGPGQDRLPPSTQLTLIASPCSAENGSASTSTTTRTAAVKGRVIPPIVPSGSRPKSIRGQEHTVSTRGAPAGLSPSVPREKGCGSVAVDASFWNSLARSWSVEPQLRPQQGGRGDALDDLLETNTGSDGDFMGLPQYDDIETVDLDLSDSEGDAWNFDVEFLGGRT